MKPFIYQPDNSLQKKQFTSLPTLEENQVNNSSTFSLNSIYSRYEREAVS